MNTKQILKKLKEAGWVEVRQNGSHVQLKHPEKAELVTVPHPKKDLPIGTLKNIEKTSGVKLT